MEFDLMLLLEFGAFSMSGNYFIHKRFNAWQTSAIYVVSK